MHDSKQAAQDEISNLAASAFAGHFLESRGENEWRCSKPGTGIYAFNVIVRPGLVVFFGDVGDWILRHSDQDSLGWLRGAVKSPDYLLEKVKNSKEHFYAADALAWLKEQEEPVLLEQLNTQHIHGELSPHSWGEALIEAGFDSDCCSIGVDHAPQMFWLVESLKKFVSLL